MRKTKKPQEERRLGLYLHIPFCRAKCAYCDFYSLPRREEDMDAYTAALCRHLLEVAPRAAAYRVDTVYFGGGTPSYLGQKRLCTLLHTVEKAYRLTADAEITLEANPDSAGDWRVLRRLRRAGFNRVSLGVQSADDGQLAAIGRVHTWAQAEEAVAALDRSGFANVSLDLIYGLPDQTLEDWQRTLHAALSLAPAHLSCYGLKVEEGTPLYDRRHTLALPDDDAQADMYLCAVDTLARAGYGQYEISNFARPGRESRHNLKYWRLEEYAGFGPGAHSDFGGVRYAYERDLAGYLAGELRLSESREISCEERAKEYVMLSLRTAEGLGPDGLRRYYRRPFGPLEEHLKTCAAHGLARPVEGGYALTPQGFLVSNRIIGDLLEIMDQVERQRSARTAQGDFRVPREDLGGAGESRWD